MNGCLSQRKDKNFKANHNVTRCYSEDGKDVCLSAKIRILKQITTEIKKFGKRQEMFVLAQR